MAAAETDRETGWVDCIAAIAASAKLSYSNLCSAAVLLMECKEVDHY